MGRGQLIEQGLMGPHSAMAASSTREGIVVTLVSEPHQYPSQANSGQQNVEPPALGAHNLDIPGVGLSRIVPVRNEEIGGAQGLNFAAAGPSLGNGFVQEKLPPRLGVIC